MNTYEKVVAVLHELCGADKIQPDNQLQTDLGLDSLGMVTLLIALEEEFHIVWDESDLNPFALQKVQDVVTLVNRYVGNKHEKES